MTITKTDAANSSRLLDKMYHSTAAQDPRHRATWVNDLPAVFASEDLEDVETHRCDVVTTTRSPFMNAISSYMRL